MASMIVNVKLTTKEKSRGKKSCRQRSMDSMKRKRRVDTMGRRGLVVLATGGGNSK